MTCLLDTNILLSILRGDIHSLIESYDLFQIQKGRQFISIVTQAEIESLALRNKWGKKKIQSLSNSLDKLTTIPVGQRDLITRYAEIDAYSQGRLSEKPLGLSAKNTGKNDIWIAATASVLNIPLLTMDEDFSHLCK